MINLRLSSASKVVFLAILIATAGLSSASLAQKGKSDQKKPPPKKEEKKAEQKKDDRTPINCVIYLDYNPDKGDKKANIAFNHEIKASAEKLRETLGKKNATSLQKVDASTTFDQAFINLTEGGKKCCKQINILGHGSDDGSLDLPYEQKPLPDEPKPDKKAAGKKGDKKDAAKKEPETKAEELSETDKSAFGAKKLGGPKAATNEGGKWFRQFVKNMKAASCPEPDVVFDACFSGAPEGIAEQVANEKGGDGKVKTSIGYTGWCLFEFDEDTKKGELPKPDYDGGSKKEVFTPPDGSTGMIFPPRPIEPGSYTVSFAGDGGRWCSYADGMKVPVPIFFADEVGNPLTDPGPIDPVEPGTPPGKTADGPPPTAGKPDDPPAGKKPDDPPPLKTVDGTPPPPKKPEEPPPGKKPDDPPTLKTVEGTPPPPLTRPEEPPPAKTPEEPPLIPDTVFVKAKESVLQGAPSGNAVPGQTVKLLPPEKPDLPGSGQTRTAQDTGFDRPPAQCTTGADGSCKMDVPPQDRAHYGLASRAGQAKQNYRVDVDIRQTTGGVIETTGQRSKPDFPAGARGIAVRGDEFRVGNRIFTRVQSATDAGTKFSPRDRYGQPGSNYEEDICRDKQPGPTIADGDAHAGADQGIPRASLTFRKSSRSRGF